jgi:putative protease
MRRPEILAPAGDQAALDAALGAGADAIYFGLDEGFNARARAANFPLAGLAATVAKIHRAGARAYVAFNTLVFERELPIVGALLAGIAAAGVDAIIVQDPAVALLARAICPALETHGSTQMTASSPAAAELVRELGLTRVVVPRELSVDEIRAYKAGTSLELEVFIHGALCVSWSGQCLTSEAWGGRSANRGQCAQSCRLPYDLIVDGEVRELGDVKYLLSPQDLAGLDAVAELADIGVASLKIEGRQKAPDYVATAVAGYRRWVDGLVAGAPDLAQRARDLAAMEVAYSRGFSPGFLGGADHQHLVAGRFPKHRGAYLGRVIRIRGDEVLIVPHADDRAPGQPPVAGAGVVFDRGRPEIDEPGGPLFRVDAIELDGAAGWRLGFGRPGPDLGQVAIGDRVWMSGSPEIKRAAERDGGAATDGRIPIEVRVTGEIGTPLAVHAWRPARPDAIATARSTTPLTAARGAGLDRALLLDKLGALGGTPFAIAALDASALAPGLHLPVSELKVIRRALADELDRALTTVARTISAAPTAAALAAPYAIDPLVGPAAIIPLCRTDAQLDAALDLGCAEIELDWMELVGLAKAAARVRAAGARAVVATVRIQKPGEARIDAHLASIAADGPGGILVRSWGALATYRALPAATRPALHGDFSLNVTNSVTAAWALAHGLTTVTAAHDLDAIQLDALIGAAPRGRIAVTAHHHIPTFHTEHCGYAHLLSDGKDYKTCGRPCEQHLIALRDRTGLPHPVIVDVGCRNTVFGAQAQSAPGLAARLIGAGVGRIRVELVRESGADAGRVIGAWRELVAGRTTPAEVLARLRMHERFGVTAGTMQTLTVLP